ncbi:MAG: hypothetical protein KDB82_16495 [Planctomycetes bacterium]|nr:hypothetical protein [Planctomycetota bacterium]
MPDAETAYLFRHALVQQAAYDLQPLSARARLHALALDIIEDVCGGAPVIEQPHWLARIAAHPTDRFVLELADHADLAAEGLPGAEGGRYARKAALYHFRGAFHEEAGYRFLSALERFESLAEHPGADDYLRAQGRIGAGQAHYRLGNLRRAAEHYDAMEQCVEGDPLGAQMLESVRTVIASHSDNGPHVAESHLAASKFWGERGDRKREVASLINYAVWHCEEGDHDIAREALKRAIEMARACAHLRAEEAAVGTLGMLDEEDGRFEEAEAGMKRALEMARQVNNEFAVVQWIIGLAELSRRMNHLPEAEAGFREAIALSEAAGIDVKREYSMAYLGVLLLDMGRAEEARRWWNEGRAGIAMRGDDYTLNGVDRSMRNALKRAGLPPLNPDGSFPA